MSRILAKAMSAPVDGCQVISDKATVRPAPDVHAALGPEPKFVNAHSDYFQMSLPGHLRLQKAQRVSGLFEKSFCDGSR